jgi:hypothetical protein
MIKRLLLAIDDETCVALDQIALLNRIKSGNKVFPTSPVHIPAETRTAVARGLIKQAALEYCRVNKVQDQLKQYRGVHL